MNIRKQYEDEYKKLIDENEKIAKRYHELEVLEELLNNNDSLSDVEKLEQLMELADEFEKTAKEMVNVTQKAKEFAKRVNENIDLEEN